MPFTLWTRGVLLGRVTSMVPAGAPTPPGLAGTIMGFFHASKDFAVAGAPLAQQAQHGVDLAGSQRFAERIRAAGLTEASDLSSEETAQKIRDLAKDDPDAQRLAASHKAVAELALELKDDKGAVVPTGVIIVQAFPPTLPGMAGMALTKMREQIKTEMAKAGLDVADLMLVAQPPVAQAN